MADKEILAKIAQLEQRRPSAMLDALDVVMVQQQNYSIVASVEGLANALDELRGSWQMAADLYEVAKVKGAKTQHVEPLRHAAAQLAMVVDALRAPQPEHREPAPLTPPDTSHERLDALVNDAVAEGRGMLRPDDAERMTIDPAVGPDYTGGAFTEAVKRYAQELPESLSRVTVTVPEGTTDTDLAAYLSGATNDLPGLAAALTPGSVRDMSGRAAAAFDAMEARAGAAPLPPPLTECTHGADCPVHPGVNAPHNFDPDNTLPKTWETDTMTPDGHTPPGVAATLPPLQAPALGQPGDMGSGYDHSYIPPGGRRLTFADLLTPVPAASLPAHLSHSQSETVGDCATKYRLQRVEALPEIPQWANIGGSAFHAAVEAFERTVAKMLNRGPDDLIDSSVYDVETVWKHHFEATIAAVQASTTVPISKWRSSRRGAEGRQWWEVEGPKMLRRYLDARPADQSITIDSGGAPAIEWEFVADVPTGYGPLPFKVVIDRVTVTADGTLMIRDYKTSYERPTDTTQLGEYAHALLLSGANLHGATKIMGTYFDARRGEWTEPVDLLAAHPFEAFQYRVTTQHAQKRALTTGPTPARPSSYCGGCAVRYACPIMASRS